MLVFCTSLYTLHDATIRIAIIDNVNINNVCASKSFIHLFSRPAYPWGVARAAA